MTNRRAGDGNEVAVASRSEFQGRVVSLRVDTVRTPSGRFTTREVVEHPGAAAVVAVNGDDVWLVRQFRYAVGQVLLELPAGLREQGEDLAGCARRELAEELGLEAERLVPLVTYHPSAGFSNELVAVHLATGLHALPGHQPDPEIIGRVRLPLAQALHLVATGEIRDGKTIIGLLLARYRLP